jgi:hypothetical protein
MAQEARNEFQGPSQSSPLVNADAVPLSLTVLSEQQNFFAPCNWITVQKDSIGFTLIGHGVDQTSTRARETEAPLAKVDAPKSAALDQTDQPVKPAPTSQNPLDQARDYLKALADNMVAAKLMKSKDRDRLGADLAAFEGRAGQAGLGPDEIKKTYENASHLIEYSGSAPLDQSARIKVAEQALHHAAYPTQIDQGRHDTCNVTTVEVRNFSRNPAAAVKLIADVATTGSFTCADGSKIIVDAKSLKTDEESSQNPAADRERSYASQIFQITAANVYWQRQEADPAGNYATRGSLRFIQDASKRGFLTGDTGERLMAYWSTPPKELAKSPALGASALKDIADQIAGTSDDGFVIENKIKGGANTVHVASEADLKDALSNLKKSGQLPAIIRVHTGNEPFLTDQGGGLSRSRGVWHVVSITAYDEQSGKVWMDNQWGKSSDHQMKVGDLYKATLEPPGNAWQMIHESTAPSIHIHWPKASTLLPEHELWLH